ncbi:MAG TPA: GAF domain-containing protein [Vicinamibacteria bacterium]|nr:GAF domain-containing protein [Vicinamibacteria bacterium]
MTPLGATLERVAPRLEAQRAPILDGWLRGLTEGQGATEGDFRGDCERELDAMLFRLRRGEAEELIAEEAREGSRLARAGASLQGRAQRLSVLDRCFLAVLAGEGPSGTAVEDLLAVAELGARRLTVLLRACEEEAGRRVLDTEEQAAHAGNRARELARANDALRRSEAQSQHRAEQIALLSSVVHRIASILDPERLMQEAAEAIQARMNHTYVAVVVLDDEGVLVGRWAGRKGVGRRSAGRAQGPAGGVIGRALRKRAPQVVAEVSKDPDYHPDVPGTHSEMVIPLLDGGEPVGAIDFQTERAGAFDLDAVAVGETLAEFLVVALRNARLFAETRRGNLDQ